MRRPAVFRIDFVPNFNMQVFLKGGRTGPPLMSPNKPSLAESGAGSNEKFHRSHAGPPVNMDTANSISRLSMRAAQKNS
jgi:hypothetical protein